ncbi:uncharacterized protein L201_004328 [Kwoniella dendrophila CBS 6074]|uniref:HIT domain-containing protein n=1 Tax=Kwoniella dendrophila CBS 6074 TaxID=1295534 RepID=A0AAX4JWX9_9TREE
MSYESPVPTPSPTSTTFDTRLAYLQRQGSTGAGSSTGHNHQQNSSISSATYLRPPSLPSHPGCVLCSLVASASDQLSNSPFQSPSARSSLLPPTASSSSSTNTFTAEYHQPFERSLSPSPTPKRLNTGGKEIVHQDSEVTVYKAEGKEKLCSDGKHLIIVVNKHVESVYEFGPSDVPLLSHIIELSHRLLLSTTGQPSRTASDAERGKGKGKENDIRVGFVGTVIKDPQSPHAHLHAHATLGPIDTSLPGATFFRRNMVFGAMNSWSVEDLRAEIREESSNNRVKSGYEHRDRAPIDRVPDAGSIAGLPNALDVSEYTDHSPPTSANKPDSLARSQSQRSARGPPTSSNSPANNTIPLSKGKEPDRTGNESNSSHQSDDSEEGYVAVDLDDLPASETKSSSTGNNLGRGGRI